MVSPRRLNLNRHRTHRESLTLMPRHPTSASSVSPPLETSFSFPVDIWSSAESAPWAWSSLEQGAKLRDGRKEIPTSRPRLLPRTVRLRRLVDRVTMPPLFQSLEVQPPLAGRDARRRQRDGTVQSADSVSRGCRAICNAADNHSLHVSSPTCSPCERQTAAHACGFSPPITSPVYSIGPLDLLASSATVHRADVARRSRGDARPAPTSRCR
jgi:hypothetical protein